MTEQEFTYIARKNSGKLRSLARRFIRVSHLDIDEDDIVQEALIALWTMSGKGYPVHNAEALLTTITKNICISNYRKHRIGTESITRDKFPGGASASERLDRQDAEKLKEKLYAGLTLTEREFVSLKEETGWTLDEMSAKIGKDKSVIKVLLSKAKRKMNQIIENQ